MIKRSKRSDAASLGVSAIPRKAHVPTQDTHLDSMLKDAHDTLVANVAALMAHRAITSDAQVAAMARPKMDQKTVWRIRHKAQSPTLEKLSALAAAFGLEVWQILIPGLDPSNPPVFVMSSTEQRFYERMRSNLAELAADEPPHPYDVRTPSASPAWERRAGKGRRATDPHDNGL